MGKSSPPDPPDPKATAAGQTSTNIGTAIANSYLNNISKFGPDGKTTYTVDGFTRYKDPLTGDKYRLPQWSQNTILTPQQQRMYNINADTKINLAQLGRSQSGKLQRLLGKPLNMNNERVEGRLFDLGRKRLDPMFAEQDEALRTRLANQGIGVGSDAYGTEMRQAQEGKNDAYNQLLLNGRSQAIQEMLQQRNQPINEIIGLMSGSQVQMPQFAGSNNYQIPNTDYAGLVQDNYNAKLGIYNTQAAQQGQMMGGLFSLLGKGIALSDERTKENIQDIGKTEDGLRVATYNYKGDDRPQVGLIAQDVARKKPEAVVRHPTGFLLVDYGKALKKAA